MLRSKGAAHERNLAAGTEAHAAIGAGTATIANVLERPFVRQMERRAVTLRSLWMLMYIMMLVYIGWWWGRGGLLLLITDSDTKEKRRMISRSATALNLLNMINDTNDTDQHKNIRGVMLVPFFDNLAILNPVYADRRSLGHTTVVMTLEDIRIATVLPDITNSNLILASKDINDAQLQCGKTLMDYTAGR